jgi:hypothetical protein
VFKGIVATLLLAFAVLGQTVTNLTPGTVSTPVLYRFFFRHLANLDAQASALDSQGQDGSDLRNYVQSVLNLSDQETATLKQYGANCSAAVQQVDQQAQAIYQQILAKFSSRGIPAGSLPQAADPRLTQLTQTRDDVTTAQVQALQAAMAASTFQKIDSYVKTQFATQVITVPIVLDPPTGPPSGPPATNGGPNQ